MGALGMALRQRYEDGGDVEPNENLPGSAVHQHPALAQAIAPQPRLPMAGAAGASVLPQGAIGQQISPDNVDPEAAGKIERMRIASAILQAGGAIPSQQAGAINVPLLAAAGALLSPTRGGGFGESLGNAATVGAKAIHDQRQQDETARLRQSQAASLADWRTGMLGVNQQNADTRQWVARRTAALKAQGMSDMAAYRQASLEARYAGIDAAQERAQLRSGDVRYTADRRAQTAQETEAGRQARFLASQDAKALAQELQRKGIDSRLINSAMIAASKDLQVITGKKSLRKAVEEALQVSRDAMGTSPSGGAPAPAPARQPSGAGAPNPSIVPRAALPEEVQAARQAIADDPANRAIVLERFRQSNVQPPPDL